MVGMSRLNSMGNKKRYRSARIHNALIKRVSEEIVNMSKA